MGGMYKGLRYETRAGTTTIKKLQEDELKTSLRQSVEENKKGVAKNGGNNIEGKKTTYADTLKNGTHAQFFTTEHHEVIIRSRIKARQVSIDGKEGGKAELEGLTEKANLALELMDKRRRGHGIEILQKRNKITQRRHPLRNGQRGLSELAKETSQPQRVYEKFRNRGRDKGARSSCPSGLCTVFDRHFDSGIERHREGERNGGRNDCGCQMDETNCAEETSLCHYALRVNRRMKQPT